MPGTLAEQTPIGSTTTWGFRNAASTLTTRWYGRGKGADKTVDFFALCRHHGFIRPSERQAEEPLRNVKRSLSSQRDQNPAATRISFVRHGEADGRGVCYGRLPGVGLTPAGQEQAQRTAKVLAISELAAVFSSPLLRAAQTALAILEYQRAAAFIIENLLLEVHSPFDGKPREIVKERRFDLYTGIGAEYEQPQDVLARGLKFIEATFARYAQKHVAAVTHGDMMAFITLWALGVSLTPTNKAELDHWGFPDHYPARGSILTLDLCGDATRPTSFLGYLNPSADQGHIDLFAYSRAVNCCLQEQARGSQLAENAEINSNH